MADDEHEIEGNDLAAVIADEIRQARNYDATELSEKRSLAISYMRGELPDVPARPNGSTQTSRDFADAVSWILPGVVRVFTASDQMVQYDKVREENDDWSRDATDYTNYSFLRESDGYSVLYDVIFDALQFGNGVVSSYWEPPRIERKTFRNKTEMDVAALMQEEGWQPVGVEPKSGKPKAEEIEDPMTGETIEVEMPTMTVKLGRQVREGKICDVACKPENLLLNSNATTIENASFVAYLHDDKTRSDLMEMAEDYGWDKTDIEDIAGYSRGAQTEEQSARNRDNVLRAESSFRSGDPIDLYECYIKADIDDDGIAELVQAWYAGDPSGGTLLSFDEWDGEINYTDIRCYPIPHRADADGLYDRTNDIMRVKTVLLRQAIDNMYASDLPMREVESGSVLNPDILVSPKFGGIIWKKPASAPILPHTIPFVADKVFDALGYLDEMLSKRTGVSRTTMALDPEALQNQTATAAQQQRDAGYSQIELIARNMAEYGGWSKAFDKRLKLAIKHKLVRKIPDKKQQGGFRQIDAGQWDPNMAVSINVGLGTGSRDRDMAMLNNVMMTQTGMAEKLAAMGMKPKALEFVPKILKTAVLMAESSGLKNPAEFYPTFEDEELAQAMEAAKQPQPDPALALEEAKGKVALELAQGEAQVTMQVEQGKNQLAAQQASVDSQAAVRREEAQLQADMLTKDKDRENAIVIEQVRQQGAERIKAADLQFEREKFALTQQLEREKMAHASVMADANNAARAEMAKQKPNSKQPNA